MNLKELRRYADKSLAEYKLAKENVIEAKEAKARAEKRVETAETAQSIVQQTAKGVQERAHQKIASVVTRCLKTVFAESPYEFKVVFEERRGKTEADLILCRDGLDLRNPIEEAGLGVVDVAAFALRLVRLMLARPKKRKVLVLDEPFRCLHGEENRERAAKLLEALSKEFKVQIIMSTGLDWLRIGKVVGLG